MTAGQAKQLTALQAAGIYVCYFPVYPPNGVTQFKFYVMQNGLPLWNPVERMEPESDGRLGKIVGYLLFTTFEEGLKTAILEAKKALKP